MPVKMTIDKQKKTVTLVLPLETPAASKSGKSMVFASTRGNVTADGKYDDKEVKVGVSCYFPAES